MSNRDFEALAAEFYRETGMRAPGKDRPAGRGGSPDIAERDEVWRDWLAARAVPVVDLMMALKDSLKAANPLGDAAPETGEHARTVKRVGVVSGTDSDSVSELGARVPPPAQQED